MTKPTRSELAILRLLSQAENKTVAVDVLRREVGLTIRGIRIVSERMVNRNLACRWKSNSLMLTFGGTRALARVLLTDKDKADLRAMSTDDLTTLAPLMRKMASMPLQVTDQPGRLAAIAVEAETILKERAQ